MKKSAYILPLVTGLLSLSFLSEPLMGQTVMVNPVSEIIQQAGPRGDNRFFNIEGNGNSAAFRSYGTLDVDTSIFSIIQPIKVTELSFSFFQSNAGFTRNGGIAIFLATDAITSLGSLQYSSSDPFGIDPDNFTPGTQFFQLGTGTFTQVSNHHEDIFTFDVTDPEVSNFLSNAFNNGEFVRFIVAPNTDGVAATWGGYTSGSGFPAPPSMTITYEPIPEPATVPMALLGALLAFIYRRRRI